MNAADVTKQSTGYESRILMRSIALTILMITSVTLFALPDWVDSFGTDTPYPDALFYTGFGIARRSGGDAEALDAAKTQAKADLIGKVQVQVRSSITSRESTGGSSVEATAVSESIAALDIEQVEYDVEENRHSFFVLARVPRETLAEAYRTQLDQVVGRIVDLRETATEYESEGDQASALRVYGELTATLQEAYRTASILETVTRGLPTDRPLYPLAAGDSRLSEYEFHGIGSQVEDALERLQFGVSRDLDAAMDLMLVQLAEQDVPQGAFRVASLSYQDSDFSSAFGAYAADAVETSLAGSYASGSGDHVVRGSYWIEDEEISLYLILQEPEGRIAGSSRLRIPAESVPASIELKPRNFQQALEDQRGITADAIVDGGIAVEVWTNKGRDADRLVFAEGDTIEFYFKVNQPCYLQLTYVLATGDRVLLEESFYIGMDRVNRVVRYPDAFEPIPPFGVERLVVTAYEDTPPQPNIVVKNIAGYDYQVFETMEAVFAATRGIRPKAKSDPDRDARVGEAALTMTTVARTEVE